jgi:hypothetical protein
VRRRGCEASNVAKNGDALRDISERTARERARACFRIGRLGGSRGLGRTYFFLAVLLLLVLFLAVLLFALELFFEPLDDLAGMLVSFRRAKTVQPSQRFRNGREPRPR